MHIALSWTVTRGDGLPWLMLAVRKVVEEQSFLWTYSAGTFSLCRRSLEKLLTNLIDNVNGFRHWLFYANKMAKIYLVTAQNKMKRLIIGQKYVNSLQGTSIGIIASSWLSISGKVLWPLRGGLKGDRFELP